MVDTGRRTPTTNPSNPGNWSNPTYAYVEDNNCASKIDPGTNGDYDCYYGGYDFSDVPDNAQITAFFVGGHGLRTTVNNPCGFNLVFSIVTVGVTFTQVIIPACTNSLDAEQDFWSSLQALGFTVADLKNGNFQTFLRKTVTETPAGGVGAADVVWIRVVYTVPAVAAQPLGDGLTFVMATRRKSGGCVGSVRSLLGRPSV